MKRELVCKAAPQKGVLHYCPQLHRLMVSRRPPTPHMQTERDILSPRFNQAYRLLVYGMSALPREEYRRLHPRDRQIVATRFQKAQTIINRMKNEIVDTIKVRVDFVRNGWINDYTVIRLPECREAYDIPNIIPFKDLGITKQMIIERLQREGLLPI